jgi:predicted metal-dependent phosphotriesterase family hydrolase
MPKPYITTVLGDIPADELGPTLAHEHLYCDVSVHSGKADNVLHDVGLIAGEMAWFKQAGGRSIVEVTPVGIGRDPGKLREIAAASGVHVVSGIAFYDQSTYPAWVVSAPVGAVADYFVRQVEEGEDGVRAGLIGELMSHNEPVANAAGYRLEPLEQKIFAAAAQAQRRTGVAISTHASLGRAGHAQLNAFEQAGADLTRVVIGHCDAHWHEDIERDLEYYLPILERGAFCQFDMIGWEMLAPDQIRAERLAALVRLGHAGKISLSTDTCRLSQMHANGGRGYDYMWTSFLPRLRRLGVTESEIDLMLCAAPRAFLTRQ